MPEIVLVTHFDPDARGHGGNHRSYQMLFDLENPPFAVSVALIVRPLYSDQVPRRKERLLWKGITVLTRILQILAIPFWYPFYRGNIYRVLTRIRPLQKLGYRLKFSSELSKYEGRIRGGNIPAACIIDHPYFECFIDVNKRYGIPTIMCGHNLESFDSFIYDRWSYEAGMYGSVEFADEYKCLARCEDRLMISVVDKSILDGLGLNSGYYPYVPVGKIFEGTHAIRLKRQTQPQEAGLLLLLGSYYHLTTAEGMTWLLNGLAGLEHREQHIRLVVVGNGTLELKKIRGLPDWVEIKGWVDQDELDALLIRAQGVLVPQRLGFGAVTRLSELACAGIPVVVSEHPTRAIQRPPGLFVAPDEISGWVAVLKDLTQGKLAGASEAEYADWASRQTNGLRSVVRKYVEAVDAYD